MSSDWEYADIHPRSHADFPSAAAAFAAALIGLIIIIFNPAQIFILLFVLPMLLITLVVSAPLLLPLVALLAGAYLVAEVISAIAREKHLHTYGTDVRVYGAPARQLVLRDRHLAPRRWFLALRWGTLISLRIGLFALGGLLALMLGLIVFDQQQAGAEQLRILLVFLVCWSCMARSWRSRCC